jgi:hypothetical protein
MLPPGYYEQLRAIGNGNASAAIVRLVDEYNALKKMNNLQKLKDPYARAQMLEALEKTLRR